RRAGLGVELADGGGGLGRARMWVAGGPASGGGPRGLVGGSRIGRVLGIPPRKTGTDRRVVPKWVVFLWSHFPGISSWPLSVWDHAMATGIAREVPPATD